jgi:prepilin-type N-terminal cleavage/methylation domain-containing protein
VVRKAFTMIELIFAIVIIAISVVSLPTMLQTTSKGIETNIFQEAIFAASAILNESTSYYWDKSSTDDLTSSGGYSRVVNTGDCIAGAINKRVGHINRSCLNDLTTSTANVVVNTATEYVQSVYNNLEILRGNGTGLATYKNAYSATAQVTNCTSGCIQFGLEASNPDIKQISVTITKTGETQALIRLFAYTANIGEVSVESLIF